MTNNDYKQYGKQNLQMKQINCAEVHANEADKQWGPLYNIHCEVTIGL